MSFFPLILFLTAGLSYIISINTEIFVTTLQKFFPQITQQFLNLLITLSEKRTLFGIAGLILSFYFASSIFTSLNTAFVHIFDGREESIKKRALIYLFGVPVFTIILIAIYFLGSFISFLLGMIKGFQLWKYVEDIFGIVHLKFLLDILTNTGMLIQFLGFVIVLFTLYNYLSPHLIHRTKIILYVSILVSTMLFVLSLVFNSYIVLASKANPIYGALSGIFAFLAWLYLTFGIILIGGRILFYLETVETGQ